MPQVDQEVLCPILQVFFLGGRVRVPPDPISDVLWEPLVELIEIFPDHESVVTDLLSTPDREGVGPLNLHRKIGEIHRFIFD